MSLWNKVKKTMLPILYEKQQKAKLIPEKKEFNNKIKKLNTKFYRTKVKKKQNL